MPDKHKKLLTVRKQKWVKQRQPDIIKSAPINPSAAVEARYYADLHTLIKAMTDETERELRKLFGEEHAEEFFAQDASVSAQARILMNALIKKYTLLFGSKSKPIADRFATSSNKASSAAVHTSLKELSGGLSLGTRTLDADTKQVMTATVAENVGLIKTIPQKYLTGVQGAVMRSITTGNGMKDLLPYIQKHKGITYRRARFIAEDQTRKANVALSTGRLEAKGVKKFRWLHTGGGQHPRELHKKLNGGVFEFANPPIIQYASGKSPQVRGLPAQLPGCRCRMIAVIEFTD